VLLPRKRERGVKMGKNEGQRRGGEDAYSVSVTGDQVVYTTFYSFHIHVRHHR